MSVTVQPQIPTEPVPVREAPPAAPEPRPGWRRRLTRRNVAGGLLLLWLLSGVYLVGTDQQAVETRFGKIATERVMPGIHYNWPWPLGQVYKLKVRQLQRAVIGGAPADEVLGQVEPIESQFLTGDQNIIHVRTAVQYSVATPADYLFRAQDVNRAVAAAAEAELGRQIAARNVDEVLTTGKVEIQEVVRERAQARIDAYGLGAILSTVNIERITPPPEAADAFRDVASARADAARVVNEAQGYSNDILPRARGEAQQMLETAQAHKLRVVNRAQGDASRFQQIAAEYARNPGVTRSRLYLETMEEILPRFRKMVVDEGSGFDLTIMRRNGGAPAPASSANPSQQ